MEAAEGQLLGGLRGPPRAGAVVRARRLLGTGRVCRQEAEPASQGVDTRPPVRDRPVGLRTWARSRLVFVPPTVTVRVGRVGESPCLLPGLGRRLVRRSEGVPAWSSAGGDASTGSGGVFRVTPLYEGLWCVGYEGHGGGRKVRLEQCCGSRPLWGEAVGKSIERVGLLRDGQSEWNKVKQEEVNGRDGRAVGQRTVGDDQGQRSEVVDVGLDVRKPVVSCWACLES